MKLAWNEGVNENRPEPLGNGYDTGPSLECFEKVRVTPVGSTSS